MGGEFEANLEQECQRRGIHLFVLPPRSPKLDGCVERAHRTHTEELYEVREFSLKMTILNRELMEWEQIVQHSTTPPSSRASNTEPVRGPVEISTKRR